MCGIFGIVPRKESGSTPQQTRRLIERLLVLSESRGKDASGLAVCNDETITVLKEPTSASSLIRSREFQELFRTTPDFRVAIGHARMETNGTFARNENNQPIVKDGCVMIHNGIIVNDLHLWQNFRDLNREFDVDTEIVNSLIRKYLREGQPLAQAVHKALSQLQGAFSIAGILSDQRHVLISTNTGSLYVLDADDYFIFASERYFLNEIAAELPPTSKRVVQHLKAGSVLLYDLLGDNHLTFSLKSSSALPQQSSNGVSRTIRMVPSHRANGHAKLAAVPNASDNIVRQIEKDYQTNKERISKLRRCTKCVLPETMPFMDFDEKGVCRYCRTHRSFKPRGERALEQLLSRFRSNNGELDCIVPFSGGRDSSYGIWYIKEVLRMNPVTYTYDWGMVTDLARRNIARICGKLGVENILISADIQRKRTNIRKNVSAWLTRPRLGVVPLFMAGDKHFLYFVNKIKRETGVTLDIWMPNRFEDTQFKVGFCNVNPGADRERIDALPLSAKIKMLAYYGRCVLENPRYMNSSIWDTLFAYYSYYFEPRVEYHLLYDYIPWDEREIERVLFDSFDWEMAPDTTSSWRIGDGTAPFYNYIYYTMAGFTEVDTFRSNQIREGQLSRDEALRLVEMENRPRIDSLKWYFATIGIDMERAVKAIQTASKRYA